jgi:hypothetical protein
MTAPVQQYVCLAKALETNIHRFQTVEALGIDGRHIMQQQQQR